MTEITLPGTIPTGDDQQWKREVMETLQQLVAANRELASKVGR